jgi:ABC-2 type transport system ATP-binding protein
VRLRRKATPGHPSALTLAQPAIQCAERGRVLSYLSAAPDVEPRDLPENAVEVAELTKIYPRKGGKPAVTALNNVSLTIPRGSFFGLLGPNGAGKSTLINILAGLVNRTGGAVRIWDFDIDRDMRAARRAIGIVPQELNIDPFFTPREILNIQAGLFGIPREERRADEILSALGLADKADAYMRSLSGGMRRRLLIAKAMVHSPPILVLDEPTAGVDVELRQQLWAYVRDLNKNGTTVLLTTHYLTEAEQLCDRIAIIDQGRVIASEAKTDLLRRLDSKHMTVTLADDLPAIPEQLAAYRAELRDNRHLVFEYAPSKTHSGQILTAIQHCGLSITDLSTRETELEDIFLRLTGPNQRPA